MKQIIVQALETPGWRSVDALQELASMSAEIPGSSAVIVEVGAFFGRSTLVLAGARQLRGAGRVHVVDPFNGDGDAVCKPIYAAMIEQAGRSLRDGFEVGLRQAGVEEWVERHVGYAADRAKTWSRPIDLLVLDTHEPPEAAFATFEAWIRHLKPGGRLVLSHAGGSKISEDPTGNALLADWLPRSGQFTDVRGSEQTVATYRGARPVTTRLYARCGDVGQKLDHFFNHYDPIISRYVIYDDGLDPSALARLRQRPMVEIRRFERGSSRDRAASEQSFFNTCWQEARGAADWVILVDVDEHLWRPDLVAYLQELQMDGVTAIPSMGVRMKLGPEIAGPARLCDQMVLGAPDRNLNKICVFRPDAIKETNYGPGRALANIVGQNLLGQVIYPDRDALLLLKYDEGDSTADPGPDATEPPIDYRDLQPFGSIPFPQSPWWRRSSLAACLSARDWDGVGDYLTLNTPDAELLNPLDIWLLVALAQGAPPDPGLALYPISAYCGELLRLDQAGAAMRAVTLARAMIDANRLDDATALFQSLLSVLDRSTLADAATGWVGYCLAKACQRNGRFESARALLFDLLTREQLDGDLSTAQSWLALDLDRPFWAEACLASLQAADRMTRSAWELTARLGLNRNFLGEAEQALRRLDESSPSRADEEGRSALWIELLWALDKSGEGPRALALLNGLSLPDTEAAMELKSWLEAGHGDPDAASALTQAAKERFPRNSHFHAVIALLEARLSAAALHLRNLSEP